MLKTFRACGPTSLEWRQLEARLLIVSLRGDKCWLTSECQAHRDHLADIVGSESKFFACLPILLHKRLNLLLQIPLKLEHPADRLGFLFSLLSVESYAPPEHRLFDLLGNDWPSFAEVFTDRFNLKRYPHQKFEVGFHVGNRLGELVIRTILVALTDEVVDENLVGLLTVAVHTPVPLLHAVRVPRDFVVDESVAEVLEIQAFGSRVSRQ